MSTLSDIRDTFVTTIGAELPDLSILAYPRPGGPLPSLTLDAGDDSADEGEGYFIPDSSFNEVGAVSLTAQLVVPIRSDIPTTLRVVDGHITDIVTAIHDNLTNMRVARVGRPVPVVETTDDGSSPTGVAVAFALRVLL